jgi:hypothetical protein
VTDNEIIFIENYTNKINSSKSNIIKFKNSLLHRYKAELLQNKNTNKSNHNNNNNNESNETKKTSGLNNIVEKNQQIEFINFEKLNIFKFSEVESNSHKFTSKSRLFEILDNGTYVVGGYVLKTRKFHLFIYDPIGKMKKNEKIFETKIEELFKFKNKTIISQRKTENKSTQNVLKIMDENLNVIREINTYAVLKNVDESHLYCIFSRRKLVLFDWNLNKIKTDVTFQFEKSDCKFYLNSRNNNRKGRLNHLKINQLVRRENKFIINFKSGHNQPNDLLIFNEFGSPLKKIVMDDVFVIDSNNNIILVNHRRDSILYYDLNGQMLKSILLERPKFDSNHKSLKQIKIDSADNIYFTM